MRRSSVLLASLVLVFPLIVVGCSRSVETAGPPLAPVIKSAPPPQDWGFPTSYTTEGNRVQVARLGMMMQATSVDGTSASYLTPAPSLDYILAFVAISADPARGHIAPDLAGLRVLDSLGGAYPATYSELVAVDGLSVGAVRFRGSPTGAKTYSLDIARVQVGSGVSSAVEGPWRLDLIEQRRETLLQGTFTGGSNRDAREMPIALAGGKVDWELRGGPREMREVAIRVEDSSGAVASVRVGVASDGAIRILGPLDPTLPARTPSSPT